MTAPVTPAPPGDDDIPIVLLARVQVLFASGMTVHEVAEALGPELSQLGGGADTPAAIADDAAAALNSDFKAELAGQLAPIAKAWGEMQTGGTATTGLAHLGRDLTALFAWAGIPLSAKPAVAKPVAAKPVAATPTAAPAAEQPAKPRGEPKVQIKPKVEIKGPGDAAAKPAAKPAVKAAPAPAQPVAPAQTAVPAQPVAPARSGDAKVKEQVNDAVGRIAALLKHQKAARGIGMSEGRSGAD